jgi:hypothetical protein
VSEIPVAEEKIEIESTGNASFSLLGNSPFAGIDDSNFGRKMSKPL